MAGTGREQTVFCAKNPWVASDCDALSADRVEILERAVLLVARMAIPEQMRAAVLARVIVYVKQS